MWNVFARLVLPVLALLVMVTVSRPGAGLIATAATGLTLLAATAAGLGLLLHREPFGLPRRTGPHPARRPGGRSRPPAAQRALRAPRRPCAAARTRRRLPARPPAAAPRRRWLAARLPRPGRRSAGRPSLADHRRHGGWQPCVVASPAGMPTWHPAFPGPGAGGDL